LIWIYSLQIGYYRFLENEKVTISELVRSLSDHCEQQVEGRHVLALSDTSTRPIKSCAGERTILALSVAVRTLQMVEGRDHLDLPATITFSADQQECLTQIEPTLEGQTSKQQNPHPKTSLPWAIWIVARLGGWSGYRSQTPPGMPTLVNGLRRFESIFEGWKLGQIRLVYTR
jgi:hypothetical protein